MSSNVIINFNEGGDTVHGKTIGDCRLILGDCMDVIPTLGKVDIVITSPPYNMRTRIRNGKYTEKEKSEHFSKKYSDFHDAHSIDEYLEIHSKIIHDISKIASLAFVNIQIVTGSKEAWFKIIGEHFKSLKDIIVWDKGHAQPAMHPSVINRQTELILCFDFSNTAGRSFSKCRFERGKMSDLFRYNSNQTPVDGHSATFPLSLVQKIIDGWTDVGDMVLDPFMGSGTTGVACVKMQRKFIGIEISEKYFKYSCERIDTENRQCTLLDYKPSANVTKQEK
jgi:site-specific DNA-methyltransferase (adenine-specific)